MDSDNFPCTLIVNYSEEISFHGAKKILEKVLHTFLSLKVYKLNLVAMLHFVQTPYAFLIIDNF